MVCASDCRSLVAIDAPRIPGRVGLHLQLTDGRPLTESDLVPSLVDRDGLFPRRPSTLMRLRADEVLLEWRNQLASLRALGIEPSHIDSHHHVHVLPGAREAYVQLARETVPRARGGHPWVIQRLREAGVSCADRCETPWSGEAGRWEDLIETLRQAAARSAPDAVIEISCHPARLDAELEARSSYAAQREQELAWLCDPALPARLAEAHFTLAPRFG